MADKKIINITEKDKKIVIEALEASTNPLFFFHDDPDGVCSLLQFHKEKGFGKYIIIKATPNITSAYLNTIKYNNPDAIFILDIAMVEQDFIDEVNVPIYWIDHHGPYEREKIKYINPRLIDENNNTCIASLSYDIFDNKKNLWLATVGAVSDWQIPHFFEEYKNKYPDLVIDTDKPEQMLFDSKTGELCKIISFMLKGDIKESLEYVNCLRKVETPYEILNAETPRAKKIYKKYEKVNEKYMELYNKCMKEIDDKNVIIFTYIDSKYSFTGDLANELQYRFPEKIIMIGREKDGEVRFSIRSQKLVIPPILDKAMEGLNGRGGGHEHAAGGNVKTSEFKEFCTRFKEIAK